jgi:hypothetical protein
METLEAIKKIPGVEYKVVKKGSKVFASRQGCDGTTCTLITKGTCKWASPDDEKCHQSRVDMNSRKGWGVRYGMFVGIFEFLVGDSIAQDKELDVSLFLMFSCGILRRCVDVLAARLNDLNMLTMVLSSL